MITLIGLIIVFAVLAAFFNSDFFVILAKGAAVLFLCGVGIIIAFEILPAVLPFLIIIAVVKWIIEQIGRH